jgi:hypothetical protein
VLYSGHTLTEQRVAAMKFAVLFFFFGSTEVSRRCLGIFIAKEDVKMIILSYSTQRFLVSRARIPGKLIHTYSVIHSSLVLQHCVGPGLRSLVS